MGLDMYLFKRINVNPDPVDEEIGYWRKQPNLHGFIANEFSGGSTNVEEIHLNQDKLEKIIKAVEGDVLPETQGFFFGTHDHGDEMKKYTIKVFREAQEFLKQNRDNNVEVFYYAWW